MSQSDLAKKLGVTQNQILKWESGMNDFKVGTLVEICKKLGLELKVRLLDLE
jgi:transcriptional regulator with XRE-family HTH domain